MRNIRGVIEHSPAAGYVRLGTVHDLDPHRLLTDAIWHTVGGEKRAILAT